MASAKVAKVKKQTVPKKPTEPEVEPEDGKKLSDYEILTTIGTGTFGRVVLVRSKETKEYLALKVMAITEVIRLKQIEHVKNEKEILSTISHPFIVNMLWANHDKTFLYMLMEYVPGGELFSYLRNYGRFNNSMANFYASEIISALDYLHSRTVVYRDLKPENLLLDREGHLKITDFGFAKKLLDRTWTLCGTPEYLAPEIIQSKGHSKAVDWWSLGILVYEMLVGYPPFFDEQPFGIYEKILAGKIEFPRHMDPVAKDLIKKLLVQDRTKRLGNMKNGAEDVKKHKWFKALDWEEVAARKQNPPITPDVLYAGDTSNYNHSVNVPPIIPKVAHDGDTKNFDDYPEDNWQSTPPASEQDLEPFLDF